LHAPFIHSAFRGLLTAVAFLAASAAWPAYADDKIDLKLISRSQAESEILWRKGFTIDAPELQQELQSLLDSLTAGQAIDPAIRLRVHLFKSPELNAFAMPDGSIYVFVGLLARLNSMEELAFVLGHEATHAIAWHGQKTLSQANKKSAIFQVLSLTTSLAIGASGWSGGLLIDTFSQLGLTLAAMASITGYSRELESEADMGGYQMLRKSGNDGCASVAALRSFLAESDDRGGLATFFWGTHPRTIDRIHALEASIGAHCAADTLLKNRYAHIKYPMLKVRARMWNGAEEPRLALRSAAPYLEEFPDDPEIHYVIGTALMATLSPDTLALATQSFTRALELGGESYRQPLLGLAYVAEAQRDTVAAVEYLEKYLADGADVPKRRSTRRHLEELKQSLRRGTIAPPDSLTSSGDVNKED